MVGPCTHRESRVTLLRTYLVGTYLGTLGSCLAQCAQTANCVTIRLTSSLKAGGPQGVEWHDANHEHQYAHLPMSFWAAYFKV